MMRLLLHAVESVDDGYHGPISETLKTGRAIPLGLPLATIANFTGFTSVPRRPSHRPVPDPPHHSRSHHRAKGAPHQR